MAQVESQRRRGALSALCLHAELCVLTVSASIRPRLQPHILTGHGESMETPRAARAGAAWVSDAGRARGHLLEPKLSNICLQSALGTERRTSGVKQMKGH